MHDSDKGSAGALMFQAKGPHAHLHACRRASPRMRLKKWPEMRFIGTFALKVLCDKVLLSKEC